MIGRTSLRSLLLLMYLYHGAYSAHFTYKPIGQTYPCILMDAEFSIKIIADSDKYIADVWQLDSLDPDKISVIGNCGESMASLILGFKEDVMWSFIFKNKGDFVTLDRFLIFTPREIFTESVTNISDPVTFNDPDTIPLSRTNESFVCTSKNRTEYLPSKPIPGDIKFSVLTKIHHFKVQAFGVKRGKYSPSVSCHEDNQTTPTPPTTPSTTTTTVAPTNAPDNTYYVNNTQNTSFCIILTGRIDIDVRYKYKTEGDVVKTRTVVFPIPRNATFDGSCNLPDGTQNLVLEFSNCTLEFLFWKNITKDSTSLYHSSAQESLDYRIKSINLVYTNHHNIFPGSILPDGKIVQENSTERESYYPHKSRGTDYYSCSSEIKMKINKNVAITTSEFKYKAFNTDKDMKFDGTASECSADNSHDSVQNAIIVLSVIMVLVIFIVITAIILYIRKRRRSYKSIRG